jgi:kynurenine formamidase
MAATGRGNWGRWGPDDERGTLNLLTDDVVRAALTTPRTGRVYALGAPVGRDAAPHFGFRPQPQRHLLYDDRDDVLDVLDGPPGVGATEDVISLPTHTATHIDALCHVHDGDVVYNGHPQAGTRPFDGARRCGAQAIGPIVARGVLADLAADGPLAPGQVVTRADVEAALERQGTPVGAGDALLLRTGWLERALAGDPAADPEAQPGIGPDAAGWLGDLDLAVLGADNMAVEAIPLPSGEALAPHVALLVDRGVHLMENLVLDALAADGCHAFLLVVAPLPLRGATASPVCPVAIG